MRRRRRRRRRRLNRTNTILCQCWHWHSKEEEEKEKKEKKTKQNKYNTMPKCCFGIVTRGHSSICAITNTMPKLNVLRSGLCPLMMA